MTQGACPEPSLLRALAEPEGLEGILPEGAAQALRDHARECPRCRERVALAGREEELLRGLATPVARSPGGLEATLAAVRAASKSEGAREGQDASAPGRGAGARALPSRRHRAAPGARSSVPWGALGAAVGMGLVALWVALARSSSENPAPAASPQPVASPAASPRVPSPAPVRPSPAASPARPAPSPARPAPEPSPDDTTPSPAPTPAPPGELPDPGQLARGPRPSPAPGPIALGPSPGPTSPPRETAARTLARAASAGLAVKGRELAAGEALPEGATIEVRTTGARVEGEGAWSLVLAQRSSLVLERGADGGAAVLLSSGKALAAGPPSSPWSVGSGDFLCSVAPSVSAPAGPTLLPSTGSATFVLSVEGASAQVTAVEGAVRVEARKPGPTDVAAVVPAGFGLATTKGKPREAPEPADAARALEWVPKKARPAQLPAPRRVLRTLDAEADAKLVTDGTLHAADAASARAWVAGTSSSYDQKVVRWSDKSPSLAKVDPSMLLEVTVRVSRRAKVSLMLFDDTANENFEWTAEVPAGRWVSLVAPLAAFANKAKAPRPIEKGDVVHALFVGAGPDQGTVDLAVQGARFLADR